MEEIFKSIPGYEGYLAGNKGTIIGKRGNQLSKNKSRFGYDLVMVSIGGKKHCVSVHKLVALAFPEICGEWFEGADVNHKNENKTDNRAENLEWCTRKYNINYGTCISRRAKKYKVKVCAISKTGDKLFFESIKECAGYFGSKQSNVSNALNGKFRMKTIKGYKIIRNI